MDAADALADTHELLERGTVRVLVRRDWREALPTDALLDGAGLETWGEPVDHGLVGRGAVHVLRTPRGEIVAKSYSRGGVIGALLRRWYADWERPLREAVVCEELVRRGCPTPPVVAARATRGAGGLYRLEIATARVPGARDLLDAVRDARDDPARLAALARDAGRTLRRLHDEGLHHRDLQVKNLLVPGGDESPPGPDVDGPASEVGGRSASDAPLVVLDLDRCELGEPPVRAERVQALARFARSLVKNGVLPGTSGTPRLAALPRVVHAFVAAYGAPADAASGRAALLRDVRARLTKGLRRHELLWEGKAASG